MPLNPNKIFLVGFMGVGKTTAGERFANYLDYQFLDTDQIIEEKEGTSIKDIFDIKGEAYFRQKEKETIQSLIKKEEPLIIATGGGIGANEELMELMKKGGKVIYIHLPFQAIMNRLKEKDDRPLAQNLSSKKNQLKLENLYNRRILTYTKASILINGHHIKKITKKELTLLLTS